MDDELHSFVTRAAFMDFTIAFLNPLMGSVRSAATGAAGLLGPVGTAALGAAAGCCFEAAEDGACCT